MPDPASYESTTARMNSARLRSRDIDEFLGLCRGVMAEGTISQMGALLLLDWLENRPEVRPHWPCSEVYSALCKFLDDEALDEDEQKALLELLAGILGRKAEIGNLFTRLTKIFKPESRELSATGLPYDEPPEGMSFGASHFVLTGTFKYGNRKKCTKAIESLGGVVQSKVTQDTKYLVVGHSNSDAWAHSSFGRKIEAAVILKDAGHPIYIMRESSWLYWLKKTKRGRISEIPKTSKSINDLYTDERAALGDLGWHISYSPGEDAETLSLHRMRKDGKAPMKSSDVSISYHRFSSSLEFDMETGEFVSTKSERERPYLVSGKGRDTKTFKGLGMASDLFVRWASELQPTRSGES